MLQAVCGRRRQQRLQCGRGRRLSARPSKARQRLPQRALLQPRHGQQLHISPNGCAIGTVGQALEWHLWPCFVARVLISHPDLAQNLAGLCSAGSSCAVQPRHPVSHELADDRCRCGARRPQCSTSRCWLVMSQHMPSAMPIRVMSSHRLSARHVDASIPHAYVGPTPTSEASTLRHGTSTWLTVGLHSRPVPAADGAPGKAASPAAATPQLQPRRLRLEPADAAEDGAGGGQGEAKPAATSPAHQADSASPGGALFTLCIAEAPCRCPQPVPNRPCQ